MSRFEYFARMKLGRLAEFRVEMEYFVFTQYPSRLVSNPLLPVELHGVVGTDDCYVTLIDEPEGRHALAGSIVYLAPRRPLIVEEVSGLERAVTRHMLKRSFGERCNPTLSRAWEVVRDRLRDRIWRPGSAALERSADGSPALKIDASMSAKQNQRLRITDK